MPGTCRTRPDSASGSSERFEPFEMRWVSQFIPLNQMPARSGKAARSRRSSRSITAGAQYTDSTISSLSPSCPPVALANSRRSPRIADCA